MKCSRCDNRREGNRSVCLECHRRLEVYRARYESKRASSVLQKAYTLAKWDHDLRQLVAELRRP